jgi:hypothetical protein
MSDVIKPATTTLNREDHGVEYTITVTGIPRSYFGRAYDAGTDREVMISSLAEMIAPVIAAHAFPNTTRTDVADTMAPYSEEHDELREKLSELALKLTDIQANMIAVAENDAYREKSVREYLDESKLPKGVQTKIIQLMASKVIKQDPVPPAA